MKKIYTLIAACTLAATQVNAQYCVPGVANPCAPETITNVMFGGINNSTGCATGYEDYTDQSTTIVLEETYNLSVTITADAAFPDDYLIAYIDWNQDEMWDANEIYPIVGPTGADGTYDIDIEVPAEATLGETRMRIIVNYNQPGHDGCEDVGYGEVEDYTVDVSDSVGVASNDIDGFIQFYNTNAKTLSLSANDAFSSIAIYNMAGQQVINRRLSATQEVINLGTLKDGVYIANATAGSNMATFKIVKR